ncbi:membrane-spanning 4-domains subfamily A member 4A isoform X2 [Festucalex cinctus]
MEDEAAASDSSTQNPLVTVTFQRDANRKQKYLEAEPKALGITQIVLTVHQILCLSIFPPNHRNWGRIPFIVSSLLVIIAGSVSIAAKNLHLPTLRGSLGMQIVSSGAAFFNVIWLVVDIESFYPGGCWRYDDGNSTAVQVCHAIGQTAHHKSLEYLLTFA